MEIVLATRNRKKVEEIRRITEGTGIKILTMDDFPGCPETEEDGDTFEENAVKKAVAVAKYTGKTALADDSGLEVDALGGEPGTRSARYSGEGADDKRNVGKLLNEMRAFHEGERGGRFVCCIALASPDGTIRTFFGHAEGAIGNVPKGFRGFGYDPVFYPRGFLQTFGEMSNEGKDALSHRGKALEKLKKHLKSIC
ncbi:MAG: XTP/dITP diphosphatase [Thermodesulfovibrionales bacterium]|nr:XTP/dITP diphosphatase [Thermodesulfovibrionales bacterium]